MVCQHIYYVILSTRLNITILNLDHEIKMILFQKEDFGLPSLKKYIWGIFRP